jgi:uncharacterized SAM-binding protein YcdF (DUF218 family)
MTYLEPLLFLFLLLSIAGLVHRKRYLVAIGLSAIFVVSWLPAAWLFSRPLETLYPEGPIDQGNAQAIVVPGSDYDGPTLERPFAVADHDTYGRCMLAAWLYRTGPHIPVIVSGQWASIVMGRVLESEGVPSESVWEEKAAHSTHENAVFSARILKRYNISNIVLVADARSMLRAKMSFEKEGLTVIPAVWTRLELDLDVGHLLPGPIALKSNEDTLHEAIGLLWYRLRGWI